MSSGIPVLKFYSNLVRDRFSFANSPHPLPPLHLGEMERGNSMQDFCLYNVSHYGKILTMNTLTIPRSLIQNDDLIVLPRRDYEELLRVKSDKMIEFTKPEIPNARLIKSFADARKEYASRKMKFYTDIKKKN